MPSKIEKLGPCELAIEVTIDAATVETALSGKFREIRQTVALPGFRPGKVPEALIQSRFGEHVRQETLEELIETGTREAITQQGLKILTPPELDLPEGQENLRLPTFGDLVFRFTVCTKPEFEVPKCKGIAVERKVRPISDETVEEVLQRFARRHASFEPVEDDDATYSSELIVQFLVTATVEGDDEPWLTDQAMIWHAEVPTLNDEIACEATLVDQLAGARIGTRISTRGTVTEQCEEEDLRGEPVLLELEVQEFRAQKTPAIDDALAKALGKNSIAELRTQVREDLAKNLEAASRSEAIDSLIDHLLANTTIELPTRLVESHVHETVHRQARRMAPKGRELTHDEMHEMLHDEEPKIRERIEREFRVELLLEGIADKHKIFCLDDDVNAELQRVAQSHDSKVSEVREYYEREGLMSELRNSIRERKTRDFLFENASVSVVELPPAAAARENAAEAS